MGFPACSLYGSLQERTGLTIRSSRCHFTAAIFFGMFVLICGRAVARLNSGVGQWKSARLGGFVWIGQFAALPGGHLLWMGGRRSSSASSRGARSGWRRRVRGARVRACGFGHSGAAVASERTMRLFLPNKAFKPNLLRYSKSVAEKACHAFASTTQVGLT